MSGGNLSPRLMSSTYSALRSAERAALGCARPSTRIVSSLSVRRSPFMTTHRGLPSVLRQAVERRVAVAGLRRRLLRLRLGLGSLAGVGLLALGGGAAPALARTLDRRGAQRRVGEVAELVLDHVEGILLVLFQIGPAGLDLALQVALADERPQFFFGDTLVSSDVVDRGNALSDPTAPVHVTAAFRLEVGHAILDAPDRIADILG